VAFSDAPSGDSDAFSFVLYAGPSFCVLRFKQFTFFVFEITLCVKQSKVVKQLLHRSVEGRDGLVSPRLGDSSFRADITPP
jgi:hypothetical protein